MSTHASPNLADADTSELFARPGLKGWQPADFDEIWNSISRGLDRIMAEPKFLDRKTYLALYESIFNFCMIPNPAFRFAWDSPKDLYVRLDEYLRRHVEKERAVIHALVGDDDVLLLFYVDRWRRYSEAAVFNRRLFTFLHRHWISRQLDEGHKLLEIEPLHLQRWKEGVIGEAQDSEIVGALLRVVEQARKSGRMHQSEVVKSTVASLRSLDVELDEVARLMLIDLAA